MRYVAFLRGINVGGRKTLKMADLRKAFEDMGCRNVRTVLASGNVLFDMPGPEDATRKKPGPRGGDEPALSARIVAELVRVFGHPLALALRTMAELEQLVASDPFRGVAVTPDTRFYVTFLSHPAKDGDRIKPPRGETDFMLVGVTSREVLTAITLSPGWGTTELMAFLEKEFGPGATTRNWNTVVKVAGG
jgi:uncharacterized protein (DUF1697 family)